jgi:hypothetical protein
MTSEADLRALASVRQGLASAVIAQKQQLDNPDNSEPLLRLLIANAGERMSKGKQVAAILKNQVSSDRTIVGVVGLGVSTQATRETVAALTEAGLPMIASTLSADELTDPIKNPSPLYYQLAPTNNREAAVVRAFAEKIIADKPKNIRIYYSTDAGDLYSSNLAADVKKQFSDYQVRTINFTPGSPPDPDSDDVGRPDGTVPNASEAGRDSCTFDGIAFFAGRGLPDFSDFLHGVTGCPDHHAMIIAGDDVSRLVADDAARAQIKGVPYYFVSFARSASAPDHLDLPAPVRDFYSELAKADPDKSEFARQELYLGPAGEDAPLIYDATKVFIHAAELAHNSTYQIPITAGTLWYEITATHSFGGQNPAQDAYEGVTGTIDFGGTLGTPVPLDKLVAIFQVDDQGTIGTGPPVVCDANPADNRSPIPVQCPHDR